MAYSGVKYDTGKTKQRALEDKPPKVSSDEDFQSNICSLSSDFDTLFEIARHRESIDSGVKGKGWQRTSLTEDASPRCSAASSGKACKHHDSTEHRHRTQSMGSTLRHGHKQQGGNDSEITVVTDTLGEFDQSMDYALPTQHLAPHRYSESEKYRRQSPNPRDDPSEHHRSKSDYRNHHQSKRGSEGEVRVNFTVASTKEPHRRDSGNTGERGGHHVDHNESTSSGSLFSSGSFSHSFRRVRSFKITSKGLRKEDLVVKATATGFGDAFHSKQEAGKSSHRVLFLGSSGVGKRFLIRDFLVTDDVLDALGYVVDEDGEKSVSILLDGEESKLEFVDLSDHEVDRFITAEKIDAYVVVYSVEDRRSYETAIDRLFEIRREDGREVAVILVANKTDLVRTRVVLESEGKSTADTYECKYIEVSAAIDHKIDELLCGILKQIRLTKERQQLHERKPSSGEKDSCCPLKGGHGVLDKLFRRSKHSSKSCENLYK